MSAARIRGVAIEPYADPTKADNREAWQEKRRVADAMRRVIERLVPSNAPAAELRAAAEGLERYAETLRGHPRLKKVMGAAESATAGDVGAFFDQSPLLGLANPLAPPITIGKAGDRTAVASVTFGSAYEGPPGSVHGGYVAAAFDEVLGYVQSLGGNPGFTGTLTIRYRAPTPLHTELLFEAELVRVEGRKTFCEGRVHAGHTLCAEAEAIFIAVPYERIGALMERRERYEEMQLARGGNAPGAGGNAPPEPEG